MFSCTPDLRHITCTKALTGSPANKAYETRCAVRVDTSPCQAWDDQTTDPKPETSHVLERERKARPGSLDMGPRSGSWRRYRSGYARVEGFWMRRKWIMMKWRVGLRVVGFRADERAVEGMNGWDR